MSSNSGGGVFFGTHHNCALIGNSSVWSGGGAFVSTLYHCTLTGNTAEGAGGGAYGGTLYSCIVYYNTAPHEPNCAQSAFGCSCTSPRPPGERNIDAEPLFVDATAGDLRLGCGSPCIDSGTNLGALSTDPTDAESCFHIDHVGVGVSASPVRIHFLSSSNRVYTLCSAPNLSSGRWSDVPGQANRRGSGGMDRLSDTNAALQKFYRVGVKMP